METKEIQKISEKELVKAQVDFKIAAENAAKLKIVNNVTAAFSAAAVVKQLRDVLSDEVMDAVFIPLMNTKIGFLTDRDPAKSGSQVYPYSKKIVRDVLIDALVMGLNPTGNQFNIIAGNMYPTKEGYSALLNKMGCKYICEVGIEESDATAAKGQFARIPVTIKYSYNGEKSSITTVTTVKRNSVSTMDNLRGKAERKAKKVLYEYLTGCDLGDAGDYDTAEEVDSRVLGNDQTEVYELNANGADGQPAIGSTTRKKENKQAEVIAEAPAEKQEQPNF